MIENTYEWNTFTKHWDISWVISNRFYLMVVVTSCPSLYQLNLTLPHLMQVLAFEIGLALGFHHIQQYVFVVQSVLLKDLVIIFHLVNIWRASSCKSSLVNSINEFTTKKVKYHLLRAVCKYIILIYAFCKHHVGKIVILSRS